MKKLLIICIVVLTVIPFIVCANETHQTSIALCYDGDVYSADYVFEVSDNVEMLSVQVTEEDCLYDWNYVQSESKLYISIASGNIIPKSETIATVQTDKNVSLTLISLKINGKHTEEVFQHTPQTIGYVAPGFDTPGQTGSEICSRCGVVLKESGDISPTGPVVNAVLDSDKVLFVSGGISDNRVAEGVTYLTVYDKENRLLCLRIITELDQSDFYVPIESMEDAHTVKILRWSILNMKPLYNAVEISVQK